MLGDLALVGAFVLFAYWLMQQQADASTGAAATTGAPDILTNLGAIPMTAPALPDSQAQIVRLIVQLAGADAPLLLGIAQRESSFNPNAANLLDPGGGSYGLFGMELTTAQQVGYQSNDPSGLYDPATATQLAQLYLAWLRSFLGRYGHGDDATVIAAWNEGPGNALKGLPDLAYVQAVQIYAAQWASWLSAGGAATLA